MKRFLALLLAVVCAFSLFSCGDEDILAPFKSAIEKSSPQEVKLSVTADTVYGELEASYKAVYSEDGSFTLEYSYEEFSKSTEGGKNDVISVKTGTVTCDKDGNYSDGGQISGRAEASVGTKLSLDAKKMTAKISADKNVLTSVVKEENTKSVFGVEFASDVTLVITKSAEKLVSYTMTYTSDYGDVVVKCEYK